MGPTVAIWLPDEVQVPTSEELLVIARSLDQSAQSSTELSIQSTRAIAGLSDAPEGRPFGFNVGEVGFTSEELKPVEDAFGFTPTAAIHAFACANDAVDHRILAELAVFLARHFGGIIDFGGNLGSVKAHAGKLVRVPYSPGSIPPTFHVGDAAFLQQWLAEPSFHMIK